MTGSAKGSWSCAVTRRKSQSQPSGARTGRSAGTASRAGRHERGAAGRAPRGPRLGRPPTRCA